MSANVDELSVVFGAWASEVENGCQRADGTLSESSVLLTSFGPISGW